MTAKVTLSFSDDTIEEARQFAQRDGVSLSAWIDQAAREKALREVFTAHAVAMRRAGLDLEGAALADEREAQMVDTEIFGEGPVLRRGEIWRIEGARQRVGLVISSDVYNGTDVPIVIVAEVVEEELLRDSPLAVAMGGYVVMPDRVSSPMKKWFTERVDVADTDTMFRVSRALRILQNL